MQWYKIKPTVQGYYSALKWKHNVLTKTSVCLPNCTMSHSRGLESSQNLYSQIDYVTTVGTNLSNPVAVRSQAQVCGRLIKGIAGSKPPDFMNISLLCVEQVAGGRQYNQQQVVGGKWEENNGYLLSVEQVQQLRLITCRAWHSRLGCFSTGQRVSLPCTISCRLRSEMSLVSSGFSLSSEAQRNQLQENCSRYLTILTVRSLSWISYNLC